MFSVIHLARFAAIISFSTLAYSHDLEVSYHCPLVESIRSSTRYIYAHTNYNNQVFYWNSESFTPARFSGVNKFVDAHLWHSVNFGYRASCRYEDNSGGMITLEPLFNPTKITGKAGDNWNNDVCTAYSPTECVFHVAPRF
jgi:hypothetical protein